MLGEQSALLSGVERTSHRFFGRTGGTSPTPWRGLNVSFAVGDSPARVEENLARCRFQLGVPRRALFTASQVHGTHILEVKSSDDPEEVRHENADGLITFDDDVAVGVRTADCAPVLIAREDGSGVAAVHAGWRGAVSGIVEAAVARLSEGGHSLVASVGPCIGQAAFEVGPEVKAAVLEVCADATSLGLVKAGKEDRSHVDLPGFVRWILETRGVKNDHVAACTMTNMERYFSHRGEAGKTGRQLSAIAKTEPVFLDEAVFA